MGRKKEEKEEWKDQENEKWWMKTQIKEQLITKAEVLTFRTRNLSL